MTTATPRRSLTSLLEVPEIVDVHPPRWFERVPRRWSTAAILVLLLAISAFIRTRQLDGQLWYEEGIATGLASHPLGELPDALRQAGASPLYYVLLHFWIGAFGSGASATHALSLLFGLLTIPIGMWVGWSLGGRRAGIFAAVMFAFNAYLTRYAEETQAFELMVLLGLLATVGLVHGLIHRRRRYLWLLGVSLAAMLYTQGTALLYWFGAAAAVAVLCVTLPDRRGIVRDAALCFAGAFVVYLPWLPTSISQIAHTTAPWHYAPLLGATVPTQLLGSERVDMTLLVATVIGIAPLAVAGRRRTREAATMWALATIPAAAFVLARLGGLGAPIWAWRYFAPVVAPLVLFATLATARARIIGVAAILLCIAFLANAGSFAPSYKSDMQDVAAEMAPHLHAGDVVVVGEPEQTPLAWYYLPTGLRFSTTTGPVAHPSLMNWSGALARLQGATPRATLGPLVASLKPGQQLLYVRPLTEGAKNWSAAWSALVRRRAAQWGQILTGDVADGTLREVTWAPHNYRGACCVANAAVLYRKAS